MTHTVTRVRPKNWREPYRFNCPGESMTEQSHIEAVNINNVVRRYMATGDMAPPRSPAAYADVTAFQQDLSTRYASSAKILEAAYAAYPKVASAKRDARKATADKSKGDPGSPPGPQG